MLARVRTKIKGSQEDVAATYLTLRLLRRSGLLDVPSDAATTGSEREAADGPAEGQSNATEPRELRIDEAVRYKARIIKGWNSKHSEQLVKELELLLAAKVVDVPQIVLDHISEIKLLLALATEKALYHNLDELERNYSAYQDRGRFNAVLYLNNLGVVHARKQDCAGAMGLFREAIKAVFEDAIHVKAPFYNSVLIVDQLRKHHLFNLDHRYAEIVRAIVEEIARFEKTKPEPHLLQDSTPGEDYDDWRDDQIRESCEKIAEFAHGLAESHHGDLYASSYAYLIPEWDTFASFGDKQDLLNRSQGIKEKERALQQWMDGMYAESIHSFQMAKQDNPELVNEIDDKIDRVYKDWRTDLEAEIDMLIQGGEHDEAGKRLRYLPDEGLRRGHDNDKILQILYQKHFSLAREADAQSPDKARLMYIRLLADPYLTEDLRKLLSHNLRKRIPLIDDDEERVKLVEELKALKVDKEIISDFQNLLESVLDEEYDKLKASGKFVEAFWKMCWSLLLQVPEAELATMLEKALLVLDHCPKELEKVIHDARLPGVGGRLQKAWKDRLKRKAACEFDLLDEEKDLLQKRFERLEELLKGDELPTSGSNKYILAEARLIREKEAAAKFREIKEKYEAIAAEPEQKRHEIIHEKIQELEIVFVNLAAGEGGSKYVEQITRYADDLRNSLRKGDVGSELRRMENEAYNDEVKVLAEARTILRSESDPNALLDRICHLLRRNEDSKVVVSINELLVGWVKRGRSLFQQRIGSMDALQKLEYLKHSLAVLSNAPAFAAPVLQEDLKPFLKKLVARYEPKVEQKAPPSPEEPKPKTIWDKLKELFTGRKPQ